MAKLNDERQPGVLAPRSPAPGRKRRAPRAEKPSPPAEPPALPAAIERPAADEHAGGNAPVVVGVGASAGGLEAFTDLLSHLPSDTGLAFVLIQHLDPSHESHLPELLSKASKMPVSELKGETRAEADHVYVIPPRCHLGISGGVLNTPPRPDSGPQPAGGLFSPCPGGRSRQQGHRRHPVGNRFGRDTRAPGDQGRGRAASPLPRTRKPQSSTACRQVPLPPVS